MMVRTRWVGLLGASLVAAATTCGSAAHAAPAGVAFQNQTLMSIASPGQPHEFEPAIKVGLDDRVYVAANHHPKGTSIRTVQLWSAPFGSLLSSDGLLPPGDGGQDVDIAVGSTGNLYDATLYLQSLNNGTGSYGVGIGACPAGSVPSAMAACYGVQNVDKSHPDRPWIAADGPSTVYVSYHDSAHSDLIRVAKSIDAGRTWATGATAISPQLRAQTNDNNALGNIVVARTGSVHAVYQIFAAGAQTHKGGQVDYSSIYMAVSTDGGQTFTDRLVYQASAGARLNNCWPVAAVDAGGAVYAGWSDGHDVWITSSGDQGATWSVPLKVSQDGATLRSSVEPWLYGGAAGNLAVVWYGSAAADNMDSTATWDVYFAQVRGATTATPSITQMVASDHSVLHGPLCTAGDLCPTVESRYLYEDFGVALDPRTGMAAIAYGDASGVGTDPTNYYQVGVAWQTQGPGL